MTTGFRLQRMMIEGTCELVLYDKNRSIKSPESLALYVCMLCQIKIVVFFK